MTDKVSEKQLFILAFDHRSTFKEELFKIENRNLTDVEKNEISDYKQIIFEGFQKAIKKGVSKQAAGVLVDEDFGADIARKAKSEGHILAMPVEKSGQKEFDFQYGDDFKEHIDHFDPTYVKALVRYNPEGNKKLNERQIKRLTILLDYLNKTNRHLLLELLVPPTSKQKLSIQYSKDQYDSQLRPKLLISAISELQQAGIEPSVWKLVGVRKMDTAKALVKQVRDGKRDASIITLGRGETMETVEDWLRIGAETSGIIGFAIGRTIFWNPIVSLNNRELTREDAIEKIAANYTLLVNQWKKWRTS